MLQLILLILKITGIVLLCLLSLILFLLCLVLFVPVRYCIQVERTEEPENLVAQAKFTWLMHILSVVFSYEEGNLKQRIRIFGIRLNFNKKKATAKNRFNTSPKAAVQDIPEAQDVPAVQEVQKLEEKEQQGRTKTKRKTMKSEGIGQNRKEKQSFFSKCQEFLKMLKDLFLNFKIKLTALIQKIVEVKENLDYYIEAFEDERNQQVMKLCFSQLNKIFRNIKPKKFRAAFHIGFEDPASTGQLLAILGMIYPFFEGNLTITPEFEDAVFEGSLFLKGRITLFVLLMAGWKIYFNKDFRRMMRILKKEAV